MRRGVYSKFDPDRMVAGEWAIVLSGAQDAANGQAAYVCFAPGQVKRVATVEDMATIIANAEPEVAESIIDAATKFVTDTNEAIKLAESKRAAAESARVSAESSRVDAESKRVAAESARVSAEGSRETQQAKNNADQAQNNAAAKGLTYQIVADGGYKSNGSHNVPTATSGSTGVVYLTPNLSSESNNLYESWMWINGAWELMGEDKHVAPTTTDDVDSIVGGTSVTADRYLNSTGLSYLWTKLVAWATAKFAALKHVHSASDVTSGTLSSDRLPTVPIAHGGTGATTADGARANLLAAELISGDFNAYTATGVYQYQGGSKDNRPTDSWGVLFVLRSVIGNVVRISQVYYGDKNNLVFSRTGTGTSLDSITWTSWARLVRSDELDAYARVNGGDRGLTNAWVGIWNGNTSDPGYRLETCWFVNGVQRGLCVDTYNRLRFYGSGVNNWSLGNLSGDKSMTPVYRLYNQYNSQHMFVTSESEYNNLVEQGWTGEGIVFYAFK
jgi:hypothetical protein